MRIGRSTGVSHPGRKRRRNEDSWVCDPPIFAVADGMGGAKGGEIASRLAASALGSAADGSAEERVVALVQEANRRVYERSAEDASASGMGTTITLALVEDDIVTFGHVGDSRAYLIREETIEQLTDDHSLVAELVRSGKLSPEEAEIHPQRSVITRALGTDPDVDVDTFSIESQVGDFFLICSDGLTSMIDDDVIREVVARKRDDLNAAARALVEKANRSGGEDNITVVCFEIAEESADVPADTAQLPVLDQNGAGDDEDTLSGLESVPTVDTMVVPPAEAQAAAAQPRKRSRWLTLLGVLLVVLVLLFAAAGLYWALYL
ncbi:MAG: Stp1/IreP family PP2C-type Ser/Thr phosphatase [Actinobacteria bacterium]|nr:Stp1/IreP family PP2C-type Ser/Thr phosphatase [Actinomycetota bacterium]